MSEADDAYIIPIKIILPVTHIHAVPENGTYQQFNYILLHTNDSAYHKHFFNDEPDILYPENKTDTPPTHTLDNTDELLNVNVTKYESSKNSSDNDNLILIDSDGYRYQRNKQYKIFNENGDLEVEFEDLIPIRSVEIKSTAVNDFNGTPDGRHNDQVITDSDEQYDEHYGKILQWLHYYL